MLSDLKVYSINVDHDGVHDNVVDPQALLSLNDFHNPEQVKICKIFHCNGLLLCTTGDSRLVVWNPCTGQISWIPIPYSGRYEHKSEFVLGYDNNKTYKILRYVGLDSTIPQGPENRRPDPYKPQRQLGLTARSAERESAFGRSHVD